MNLKEPNISSKVADLCCEMRVKKNTEKMIIKQQIEDS